MTNLVLIRHGEAEANVRHIVGGMRGDTGLTPRGVLQAERLRDRLAATGEITAHVLLASTLPRARQTAEIIAPALDLEVTLDDELHELRPGEADGLPLAEAIARFGLPDFEREPERPLGPGAESWHGFMGRVAAAIDRIVRAHEGNTIVAVTHGGFVDGAFAHFLRLGAGFPPAQFSTRHASITHWQKRPRWNQAEGWHLVTFNDAAHLRDIDRSERIPWAALRASRA
ncbi:MAG: histidine phosphatase family protein [Minicystis sp.]